MDLSDLHPSNTWFQMSQLPNGISIGSAVYVQYINVTNTHTRRPRYM